MPKAFGLIDRSVFDFLDLSRGGRTPEFGPILRFHTASAMSRRLGNRSIADVHFTARSEPVIALRMHRIFLRRLLCSDTRIQPGTMLKFPG